MRRFLILFLAALCLVPAGALGDAPLPEALRVHENVETQTLKGSVYVNTAYPATASSSVDAEMRLLLDAMREKALPFLPSKAASKSALGRAPDLHSGGRGFDSLQIHQTWLSSSVG